MPKDVTHFDQMDSIWVSSLSCILPVANAPRVSLIELASVRRDRELLTVLEATSGMYGDLQGIAGQSLEEIDALEGPMRLSLGSE